MANKEHLARLRDGVDAWNAWREERPDIVPNLCRADLSGAHLGRANLSGAFLSFAFLSGAILREARLSGADLREADLSGADLFETNLIRTDLSRANLSKADLRGANLSEANLRGAKLRMADLRGAQLLWADFSGADLRGAGLQGTVLVGTNFENADLTGCRVHGISAWDVKLKGTIQPDLVITMDDQPEITVDNLEVAQFIYLLLHNEKIRNVIDTITSKVVLILGRFTEERKVVLDALREELRKKDYLPVLFDFDKPASKDLTGTVSTLANMARFIIADLTDPSCIPHELAMIIPTTVVPVQPILLEGMSEYAMFIDLKKRHHWLLEPYSYKAQQHLIADLRERVIDPAEAKVRELRG